MKVLVYAGFGIPIDEIEAENEEELQHLAWVVAEEWLADNMFWEEIDEEEEW